jgi:hypothetical protein
MSRAPRLIDTSIFDIRRRVMALAAGQLDDLQISILNEEEIVLRGNSQSRLGKDLAQIGAQMAAPDAAVRNEIDVSTCIVARPPRNPRP